jgi:MFS family permease
MLSKATLTLGLSQTIAWASSYYLPAVLAAPIARDLGTSTSTVYAGFSWALLVAAPLAPVSGKLIDRFGGRAVLMITSLLFAMGMMALASVSGRSWALPWVVACMTRRSRRLSTIKAKMLERP